MTALHPAFKPLRTVALPSLNAELQEFEHIATGALHQHIACANDENTFLVGFRTQPTTSNGVAHVLEHTVLCGSAKYPVRDPFFSMIKRSLNTFMNAFTAADWTAYPFASQNRKDFDNLLGVYLDAVFFPNIHPLDFSQEGIRVEIEDNQAVYKGVVFNEMKGACSSPNDQLYHAIAEALYTHTTYHFNSGGDPKDIPGLTHAQLVDFHQTHYHPSNAVFMTFGDIAASEHQQRFEVEALSKFNKGKRKQSIAEPRIAAPKQVHSTYTFDQADTNNQTYVQMAWLLPKSTDFKTRLALRLLESLLLEHSATPLRQFLETCGLGQAPSPILGLDDSHYEMVFYAGLQGSNAGQTQAIETGIINCLQQCVNNGFSADEVAAAIHQMELNEREITGDGMPYGLRILLKGLDSSIHDGDALDVWNAQTHLEAIKAEAYEPHFFAGLIQTHLLDNPHRVTLTMAPDPLKSAALASAEQSQLNTLYSQLDDTEKAQLVAQAHSLTERQALEDDPELLPKVTRADIPTTVSHIDPTVISSSQDSAPLWQYTAGTNGLYYAQMHIALPSNLLANCSLRMLAYLFAEVGAGSDDYLSLQSKIARVCGGLSMGINSRTKADNSNEIQSYLVLSTRGLCSKTDGIALLKDVFTSMRFDEYARIKDLLLQRKASWLAGITSNGHGYAMQCASHSHNLFAAIDYQNSGLPALQAFKTFCEQLEQTSNAQLAEQLAEMLDAVKLLHQQLIALPREYVLVATPSEITNLATVVAEQWQHKGTAATATTLPVHSPFIHKTAWLVQSNVYFCAVSYPTVPLQHSDAAPLMLLGGYLRNGYLHRSIREQGGAYGGGASYDANTCSFKFFSYRDPRMAATLADFKASVQWLLTTPQQAYQLEEALLGAIASMDKPGSPAGEAISSCMSDKQGRGRKAKEDLRAKLLAVSIADLQRVATTYLLNEANASYSVVAPYEAAAQLSELDFITHKI